MAIVDIRMPPTHTDEGLRAAKTIRERWPSIGILVLSQHVSLDPPSSESSSAAGARATTRSST